MRYREITEDKAVAEVNSPGELSVDHDLIKRFVDGGWEIDGEGRDQIVMSRPGTNRVLKIVGQGTDTHTGEIRRAVQFFRDHQRNPHFPRVGQDRTFNWKGQQYYVYTQERLTPLSGDEEILDYLEYVMGEIGHGEDPDYSQAPPGLTVEQVDGLVSAIYDMFDEGMLTLTNFDLGNTANIMQRDNGQLVIVDPTSHMQDLVEAWSAKYKRSINCNNPKGFSQRAHCQGRKKNEDMTLEAVYPGNLGMMELAQFLRQHPEHRQRYHEIKSQQGVRAAMEFVLKKLNVKLSGDPYRAVAEDKSQYKEIEFVCVNPEFPEATDPELQKQMYQGLTKIPGVIPLWQEWGDYSEGQASLAAIYRDPAVRKQVLALAKQLGVKVDLEQPVSDDYVDLAIRGEHEGQQVVEENFADGKVKGKSRPGRVKRAGASCKGSVTDLRARAKKYGGEKGKMYHWCANMKSGRKK